MTSRKPIPTLARLPARVPASPRSVRPSRLLPPPACRSFLPPSGEIPGSWCDVERHLERASSGAGQARHFRRRLTCPCHARLSVTSDVEARHDGHGVRGSDRRFRRRARLCGPCGSSQSASGLERPPARMGREPRGTGKGNGSLRPPLDRASRAGVREADASPWPRHVEQRDHQEQGDTKRPRQRASNTAAGGASRHRDQAALSPRIAMDSGSGRGERLGCPPSSVTRNDAATRSRHRHHLPPVRWTRSKDSPSIAGVNNSCRGLACRGSAIECRGWSRCCSGKRP